MSSVLERRLAKLEEIRDRNDVGSEVDIELERMGTSRAALLADFGSPFAFRDWLVARTAAEEHPAGVQPSTAVPHRKWPIDGAVSAKWDAILDRYATLQPADTSRVIFLPEDVEMSRTLERRTARLEAHRSNVNQIAIIVRRIVGRQIFRAVIGDDVVNRRADENECAFIERSRAEALAGTVRRPCRMILLGEGGRR